MNRFNIGDTVWFPFDKGNKEQTGVIENIVHYATFEDDYLIRGNVDGKLYTLSKSKLRITEPRKKWLDQTPDWEAKANDAADSYSYICNWWGIAKPMFPEAKFLMGQYVFCDVYGNQYYGKIVDIRRYDNPIEMRYRFIYDVEVPEKGTFSVEEERLSIIYFNKEESNMKKPQNQKRRNRNQIRCNGNYCRDISEIIFNGPATIIKWKPSIDQWAYNKKGDKTVATCSKDDAFNKTTGFLLAIIKEFFDNQSYDNILRKIDSFYEEEEETLTVYDIVDMLPKEERLKLYYELGKAIRENEIDIHQKKRPERKYNLDDQVTCIKSKKHVVYEIDNYRWNPDYKIWMYRCVTENGYTRWYLESSLIKIE